MSEFPSHNELKERYKTGMAFSLESEAAKPLLIKYSGGESQRRYYQDAAIRAVFEKIAHGKNRALLSLATGAGKTFIAVNMLKRIADVILFVYDILARRNAQHCGGPKCGGKNRTKAACRLRFFGSRSAAVGITSIAAACKQIC
jgi:hypothetical protein